MRRLRFSSGKTYAWRCPIVSLPIGIVIISVAFNVAAYRTGADIEDFDGTERVRWAGDTVNFTIVDEYPGSLASESALGDEVREAMAAWTDVDCASVRVGSSGWVAMDGVYDDGQNTIQWLSSGWEERGFLKGAAGATDIKYEIVDDVWTIVEADVYLNAQDHDWTLDAGTDDEREASGVLTHELGHALGLLHPCKEDGKPECTEEQEKNPPTMYPAYSHGQLSLESDDRAGICFLYPTCSKDSCGEGRTCTDFGCVDICGGGICGTGETCIEDECVDENDPCEVGDPECEDCVADEQCGKGFQCIDGECLSNRVPDGDPCSEDFDCESRVCLDESYCSTRCAKDADCGDEGKCDTEKSRCEVDSRGPLGAECDSADDCLGYQCVADFSDTPLCTRACSEDGEPCPFDWVCMEVDQETVCRPPSPPWVKSKDGCSCNIGPGTSKNGNYFLLLIGAVLICARRRSSRERTLMMGKAL